MRIVRLFSVVFVLLGLSSQAFAYVLPADYIMRMLADKISRLKIADVSIKLESQITTPPETFPERLYLKRAERARLLSGSEDTLVYLENEGKIAQSQDGAMAISRENRTDLLTPLLFPVGKNLDERSLRMLDVLAAAGVDTSVVALGRIGSEPVYMVGARPFEPEKPQVWFNKTSFVVVRSLLYTQKDATGDKIEKRYLEYQKSAAGKWFPGSIETWRNGLLVKEQVVLEAKKNQELPETLFTLP